MQKKYLNIGLLSIFTILFIYPIEMILYATPQNNGNSEVANWAVIGAYAIVIIIYLTIKLITSLLFINIQKKSKK